MIWHEYDTSKMPARPLVRPKWNEVKGQVMRHIWQTLVSLMGVV